MPEFSEEVEADAVLDTTSSSPALFGIGTRDE
jgi:hypothetical protein